MTTVPAAAAAAATFGVHNHCQHQPSPAETKIETDAEQVAEHTINHGIMSASLSCLMAESA